MRHILTPFIVAMIFAYLFNPLINFFSNKFRVPRTLSILLVYILLIISGIFTVLLLSRLIIRESASISKSISSSVESLRENSQSLPEWVQPYVTDYLDFASSGPFLPGRVSPFPLFTRAFTGVLNVFIFLFSAFFFLKDNRKMRDRFVSAIPAEHRDDAALLIRKINIVLSSYLRGQIILIAAMVIMLYGSFLALGIKFALTLAVISALFEIVPLIGPVASAILGTFIIVITGGVGNFYLSPIQTIAVVVGIYYVSRQIQDYLIQPFVVGRATRLHPLLILFSVLTGQHLYGILGIILAVPVAATLKIIYEFVLGKIRQDQAS